VKLPNLPGLICKIRPHAWRERKASPWFLKGHKYRKCRRCGAVQVWEEHYGGGSWHPKTRIDEGRAVPVAG